MSAGDMADDFRALREHHREQRRTLGVSCPDCQKNYPKRAPTILLPGQLCRWCGYRDARSWEQPS